jgi:hypothetical protein
MDRKRQGLTKNLLWLAETAGLSAQAAIHALALEKEEQKQQAAAEEEEEEDSTGSSTTDRKNNRRTDPSFED